MRHTRHLNLAIAGALLLAVAGGASAQDEAPPRQHADQTMASGTANNGAMDNADSMFMRNAAAGNLAEVKMGHMAVDKSSSPQLKEFGQRLIDDHTKANEQLMTLAQRKQVTLPTEPMAKAKTDAARLDALSGDAFDKAWSHAMVKDHKKDVAEYRKESRRATDSDIRQYASNTLPTLKSHLQMAEQLPMSGANNMSGMHKNSMDHKTMGADSMQHASMDHNVPAAASSTH